MPLGPIVGALISVLIGSLFAGADTALTSLTSTRLAALIDQSTGSSQRAYGRIQRDETRMRARYLIGRILCTATTAVCLVVVFGPLGQWAPWAALGTAVVLSGVLFELSTTLGKLHADRAALLAARWLRPLELAMTPLALPLGWAATIVNDRGLVKPPDPRVAEADLWGLVLSDQAPRRRGKRVCPHLQSWFLAARRPLRAHGMRWTSPRCTSRRRRIKSGKFDVPDARD